METRKVQLSGGTTYTVSLPKSWAEEHGIEAGTVLYLHPDDDGTLLVEAGPDRAREGRRVDVDVTQDDDEELRETIGAAYVVGADEIVLEDRAGRMAGRESAVREAIAGLSGLEVFSVGDRTLTLRNLIDAEQISIRKSLLRLRLITLAMHRDAVDAVLEGDEALAEAVVARDNEADKLFALITRHFRRAGDDLQEVSSLGSSRGELFEYYYVARQAERIADHAVKVARIALTQEEPPSEPIRERFATAADRARRIVSDASDVVLADADLPVAYDAMADCDDLVGELDAFDRELYDHDRTAEAFAVGLLVDSVRRTAEYGRNIAEVAIQRAIRRADA